jgi:predicted small secreted protein
VDLTDSVVFYSYGVGMLAAVERTAEVKMKMKTLLLGTLLLIVLASEGCATVRGMGEDIQSVGRAVKRAVSGG